MFGQHQLISAEGCPESLDTRLAALEYAVEQMQWDSKQKYDRLEVMIGSSAADISDTEASLTKLGCNFVSYQEGLVKILKQELVRLPEMIEEQESVTKEQLRALVNEAETTLSIARQQIMVEINAEWERMQDSLGTAQQCILDIRKEDTAQTLRPTEKAEMPIEFVESMLREVSKDISEVHADFTEHVAATQKRFVALEARQCVSPGRQTAAQSWKPATKDAQPSPVPVSLSQSKGTASVSNLLLPSTSQSNLIRPINLRPTSSPSRAPQRQSPMRHMPETHYATTASVPHASVEKAKQGWSRRATPIRSAVTPNPAAVSSNITTESPTAVQRILSN